MSDATVSLKLSELAINTNKQDGGLVPKDGILFRNACTQNVNIKFVMTNYGCFICQQNFVCFNEYDAHIQSHGKDEILIPASSWSNCSCPTFVISYDHCADSNLLNFKMKSNKDVVIEKIVIVRPEVRKLMHCVEKSKIQISKENRTYNFSVDCFLFDKAKEHPFFVIYRNFDDEITREIEKYIFFRQEQFPKSKLSFISSSVPHNAQLVFKSALPQHFPSLEVRNFCQTHYQNGYNFNTNFAMMQYLVQRQLKQNNYGTVFSFLLQMEDQSILVNYEKLTLRNPALKSLGGLDYSVTFPEKLKNNSDKFVSEFDDIVVSNFRYEGFYDCDVLIPKITKKGKRSVGYIYKVKNNTIFFTLRTKPDTSNPFKVKVYPHRMPLRYQHEALNRLANCGHILRVLLPPDNITAQVSSVTLSFFNKSIEKNPEQAQAVKNIITNSTSTIPYIIFGPPGTGKSTTIVESILQLWKTKQFSRILVTSGSNAACDEVAKRLCKIFEEINVEGLNLLRIYATSYERKMDNTNELLFEASNFAHGYHFYPSLDSIYLFRIVVATLSICGKLVQGAISDTHFTHIFIDECAASTEPEALVGIVGLMGPETKLILSGDPKQLGPVLKCEQAENFGLGISMMERLLSMKCYAVDPKTNEYDRSLQTILRRNYRSNANILSISNKLCYNSQLLACAKPDTTEWAKGWKNLPSKKCPILFHVVHGKTVIEKGDPSSKNLAEIEIVMKYVRDILKNGINGRRVTQNEIGVISPYKKQYTLIRHRLDSERYSKVETGSAETFQGQEKPIIIISTVKSWMNIGFLKNVKRLNVMLTRAQALMIIVGNPESLQKDDNWFQVLQYFKRKNAFKGKTFKLNETIIQEPVTNFKIGDNYNVVQASKIVQDLQNSHTHFNSKIICQPKITSHSTIDTKNKDTEAKKRRNRKVRIRDQIRYARFREKMQNSQTNITKGTYSSNPNNSTQQNFLQSKATEKYSPVRSGQISLELTTVQSKFSNDIENVEIIFGQESKSTPVEKEINLEARDRKKEKIEASFESHLKIHQKNKLIDNFSNSINSVEQNLVKTEVFKRRSSVDSNIDFEQLSLDNKVKRKIRSASAERFCNNNDKKEINCQQEKISNSTAENTSTLRTEEEADVLYNVAQVHLENLQTFHKNSSAATYSYNTNHDIQQNIVEVKENSSKDESAVSLENSLTKDPISVPTVIVHPTSFSNLDKKKTDCHHKSEKKGTAKPRKREEEQIEAFYTMASLLLDDKNIAQISYSSKPVLVPTATVRPTRREVPKQNIIRPECDWFPYEEWDIKSSYTKCPPLNDYYYIKPKIKEESDSVVL